MQWMRSTSGKPQAGCSSKKRYKTVFKMLHEVFLYHVISKQGAKKSLLVSFKFYFEILESTQKALQFTPSQAQEAFARFCKNLDEIETKIEARNKVLVEGGKVPYTILLPSKIPAGIAV